MTQVECYGRKNDKRMKKKKVKSSQDTQHTLLSYNIIYVNVDVLFIIFRISLYDIIVYYFDSTFWFLWFVLDHRHRKAINDEQKGEMKRDFIVYSLYICMYMYN